jgi:general stress protein YciG
MLRDIPPAVWSRIAQMHGRKEVREIGRAEERERMAEVATAGLAGVECRFGTDTERAGATGWKVDFTRKYSMG